MSQQAKLPPKKNRHPGEGGEVIDFKNYVEYRPSEEDVGGALGRVMSGGRGAEVVEFPTGKTRVPTVLAEFPKRAEAALEAPRKAAAAECREFGPERRPGLFSRVLSGIAEWGSRLSERLERRGGMETASAKYVRDSAARAEIRKSLAYLVLFSGAASSEGARRAARGGAPFLTHADLETALTTARKRNDIDIAEGLVPDVAELEEEVRAILLEEEKGASQKSKIS